MNTALHEAQVANTAAQLFPLQREAMLESLFMLEQTDIVHALEKPIDPAVFSKAALLHRFSDVQSGVTFVKDITFTDPEYRNHPLFVGNGASMNVFASANDASLVIKRPRVTDPHKHVSRARTAAIIDDSLNALLVGSQIPGLEKPVAASYRAGLLVNERMQGKQLDKLTPIDGEQITQEQISSLLGSIQSAYALGIGCDPNAQNIFYDAVHGFGVIDYSLQKYPNFSVPQVVGYLVSGLVWRSSIDKSSQVKQQVLSVLGAAISDFQIDTKLNMIEPLATIERHQQQ